MGIIALGWVRLIFMEKLVRVWYNIKGKARIYIILMIASY